jgi:hypothetical protein
MAELNEKQRAILNWMRDGKVPSEIIELGFSKSAVYAMAKRFEAGEFKEPSTALALRSSSAVAQPEQGGDDHEREMEALRQRNIELTEFALDTAMENAKLKRVLATRE